jgi:hypothetical protein
MGIERLIIFENGGYGNSPQREIVIRETLVFLNSSLVYALNHVECLKQFSQWYFFRLL